MKNKGLIIAGVSALGLLGLYLLMRPKKSTTAITPPPPPPPAGGGGVVVATNKCPAGQVSCFNNPSICFDPNVMYIIDPCTSFIDKGAIQGGGYL